MKQLIPKICPICNSELELQFGKTEDIIKLYCPNVKCDSGSVKKLQKAVEILELKNIGPSTIEKIYKIGINSIIDLFDKSIVNQKCLLDSGEFKRGKQLSNILNSIESFKQIQIDKAIYSLQIQVPKESGDGYISIGKALSLEIAKMLSNLKYDFTGLSLQVREDIENKGEIYNNIINNIENFKKMGIEIIYLSDDKPKIAKSISKKVCYDTSERFNLDWEEVNIEDAQLLVVDDISIISKNVEYAKNNGIKILTVKQVKLVFV